MADLSEDVPGVEPDSVQRGYESRDLRIRPLVALFAGFVVLFAFLCGGLWWFYRVEATQRTAGDVTRSIVRPTTLPNSGPPLQPQVGHESLDAWDLQKMRDQEDATFAAIGWRRDARTKRFAVPADVIKTLRQRQAATRPTGGARR